MEDRQLVYLFPCGFPESASCWSWELVQSNGWVKGGLEKEDLCGPLEMGVGDEGRLQQVCCCRAGHETWGRSFGGAKEI